MSNNPVRIFDSNGVKLESVSGSLPVTVTGALSIPTGATWFSNFDASTANTENTETVALVAAKQHYLLGLIVDIEAAAAGTAISILVKDGTTTKIRRAIPSGAVVGSDLVLTGDPLFVGTVATALNIVVSAGGAACVTGLSYWGYTV